MYFTDTSVVQIRCDLMLQQMQMKRTCSFIIIIIKVHCKIVTSSSWKGSNHFCVSGHSTESVNKVCKTGVVANYLILNFTSLVPSLKPIVNVLETGESESIHESDQTVCAQTVQIRVINSPTLLIEQRITFGQFIIS